MNLFTALLLIFSMYQQPAQNSTSAGNCGLVYGKSHAFWVCAPKGWYLDNTVLNDSGIYAVFYPQGSSFEDAKEHGSIMYVNTVEKRAGQDALDELIHNDAAATLKSSPKAKISSMPSIHLDDGVLAHVQRFQNSDFGRSEAVAYIESPKIFIMIAITSKDDASFDRDLPRFVELVKSYKFMTDKVQLQGK